MNNRARLRLVIYGIAAALIATSWFGNYAYDRYFQLAQAGFLTNYIEATDTPSVAFDLLYVANNDDKRTITGIRVNELPYLRFSPMQVHQQLSRQTIYSFMGQNTESPKKAASAPLRLHDVNVYFSDGTTETMPVGEIIVYRNAYPSDSANYPVNTSSSSSSSDNTGSEHVVVMRPVTLTGTTSAWLPRLGSAFQFDVKVSGSDAPADSSLGYTTAGPGAGQSAEAEYPMKLQAKQSIATDYRFSFPKGSAEANNVYNVLLSHTFLDANGKTSRDFIFANYKPYFTESQMRKYVREQRRAAP